MDPCTPFHHPALSRGNSIQNLYWRHCLPTATPFSIRGGDWQLWVDMTLKNPESNRCSSGYNFYYNYTGNCDNRAFQGPQVFTGHQVCNPLKACLDLRPFLTLNGTLHNTSISQSETNSSLPLHRYICVNPPFLFLLAATFEFQQCNETESLCGLSNCWNGHPPFAVLVYRPSFLWVPVETDSWVGPVVQQISASQLPSRHTRNVKDWLINALGVAASVFVPAIGHTVLQAWTMNQIALTMDAVNTLANETAFALRKQELLIELNSQTILEIQREIDEIGQEIDNLWNVATRLCDQRWLFARLCVTPARTNLTNTTKKTK